jgi:hypothetical protein
MICQPCKDGGTFSFAAKDAALRRRVRQNLLAEAFLLHEKCDNPTTCACQHRVGK